MHSNNNYLFKFVNIFSLKFTLPLSILLRMFFERIVKASTTFSPVVALVSIKPMLFSKLSFAALLYSTALLSFKSNLFPTKIMQISGRPKSRASFIHCETELKLSALLLKNQNKSK